MGEFELIRRYFTRPTPKAVLGVGDDCALLQAPPGVQTAIASDMLVAGRHFFPDVAPRTLGHKALAVNLSDLAACGATPEAFTLALALPQADEAWLQAFSEGLLALADAYGCELIGGDTTQGPLTICITVFGEVPRGQALLRSGAQVGDDVFVSGTLGDARLALEARRGTVVVPEPALPAACQRMDLPTPRIELGQSLRGIAHAAADISDGLAGDLGHILQQSGVGATLHAPMLSRLMLVNRLGWQPPPQQQLEWVLSGGDDYELVFTAPPEARAVVQAAGLACGVAITRIGQIDAEPGLRVLDAAGQPVEAQWKAFDHFAAP